MPQASKSQSLERGLDLLELINRSDRPLGTREISRMMDLSPSMVQRLINTLAERNYLIQDAESRRYAIGYQALTYATRLSRNDLLLARGREALEKVTQALMVDTFMAMLQGNSAFYLLCLPGGGPMSVRCEPGQTIPLHSTAIGKCLLAAMGDDQAAALLGPGPYPTVTPHTITDPAALLADLRLTRERGYAVVRNENIDGLISVGAIVPQPALRPPVAISLSFSPFFSRSMDVETAASAIDGAARQIAGTLA